MKIPRGGLPAHEVGPFFFVIQLRMMCNYNGLASQEYLRGVTSFTEVRSEGVRFARDSLLEEGGFEPSVPPLGHGVSLRPS